MKRTVTIALLAAALLLPGQTAHADDPTCAAGEEWQGEFGCVAVQLPEESTGGYRCPDPYDTVPCDEPVNPAPAAGPAVSAPVVEQPAPAPVADANTTAEVGVAPPATAPAAAAPPVDLATFIRALLARFLGWLLT